MTSKDTPDFITAWRKNRERIERYRIAKAKWYKRAVWAERIHNFLTPIAEMTGLCPDGNTSRDRNHWSKLFAQVFYVDCLCCLTFRMLSIGIVLGLTVGVFIGYIISMI